MRSTIQYFNTKYKCRTKSMIPVFFFKIWVAVFELFIIKKHVWKRFFYLFQSRDEQIASWKLCLWLFWLNIMLMNLSINARWVSDRIVQRSNVQVSNRQTSSWHLTQHRSLVSELATAAIGARGSPKQQQKPKLITLASFSSPSTWLFLYCTCCLQNTSLLIPRSRQKSPFSEDKC